MIVTALGSSFASGAGIEPTVDRWARRSGRNYASLVATALEATLVDVSSAGATTWELLDERQHRRWRSRAPQINAVNADSAIVLVTVGGNDVGYLREVTRAARTARRVNGRHALSSTFVDRVDNPMTWESLSERLTLLVDRIRDRSPRARVIFVDYLPLVGDGGSAELNASAIAPQLAAIAAHLSHTLERAARDADAEFVAAPARSRRATRWITGLDGRPPFHPTAEGMEAVAVAVLEHLRIHPNEPKESAG